MVRTRDDEPCIDCRIITNFYDRSMGRLCPKCTARRCEEFGQNLAKRSDYNYVIGSVPQLAQSLQHLLTDPLIDHSNDIDARIMETKND